jgi:hypothetical protein
MNKLLSCLFAVLFLASPSFAIYRAGMSYIRPGSEGSQYKRYGRWELRMRYIGLNGTVNCFVLVSDGVWKDGVRLSNPETGPWQEYDMEICGNNPDHISTTLHINHWRNEDFSTGRGGGFETYPGFNTEFHTWACEWTPDYVTWEVDGQVYRKSERIDGRIHDFQWPVGEPDAEPKEVIHDYDWIDMWSNDSLRCAFDVWECDGDLEGWCGDWDPANDGSAIFYCYFRHYIYTPDSGPDGSDFTLEFSEDYDGTSFDKSAWDDYGCELRGGFAVGAFGADYTGELPDDPGDINVSTAYAPYARMLKGDAYIEHKSGNITYGISKAGAVKLAMYDLNGRLVQTLVDSYKNSGDHTATCNMASIPAGTYVVSLKTPTAQEAKRIVTVSR